MLDHLKFERVKKDLPQLKVVLLRKRDGQYIYSTDLSDLQRVKDTWDIIKTIDIKYSLEHPKISDTKIYKFLYGVVQGINVAYDNKTWETRESLLVNLRRFGENSISEG